MTDRNESLCRRFQILLSERLDRALTTSELEELQTHLSGCPSCREFASALRLSDQLARESPAVAPLAGERLDHLVASVMARVNGESTDPDPARSSPTVRGEKSGPYRSWREFFSDWGFPSVAGAVALAVLAFFLLRSPQAPSPTPAGKSLDRDLLVPAERRSEEVAEKKAQAADALKETAPAAGKSPAAGSASQAPADREKRAFAKDETAEMKPSPNEARPKAAGKRGGSGSLSDYAVESARVAQAPDSLTALKELGAHPPLSLSQRDSLRSVWNMRLKESSDAKEQATLRVALDELEKLPPPKD